jgi:hypothetical protein
MNKFCFFLILLLLFAMACRTMKSAPSAKPETAAVTLPTLQDAPQSVAREYEVGDEVAVIGLDGRFEAECKVRSKTGTLVLTRPVRYRQSQPPEWLPIERVPNLQNDEQTVPVGYEVEIGFGRNRRKAWFPPTQMFPAPWANARNLQVGDTVWEKTFGPIPAKKAVIIALPVGTSREFRVRYAERGREEWVARQKLFAVIEPAQLATLRAGDIVSHENMQWAMVMGQRDGKVIIREDGFPVKDQLVEVSQLLVCK